MSKRVLILVLSMDESPYRSLAYASKQTWDSIEVKGVETVFYFGHEGVTAKLEYDPIRKNLFTGTGEGLTAIGYKNIAAMEWALDNMEFDYIIRANASTYVNKRLVHEYVQNLPTDNLYMGVGAPYTYNGQQRTYLWGPHWLMSRDVVQKVVDNKDKHDHGVMDDVAMSMLMYEIGIPLNCKGPMAALDIDREAGGYNLTVYNGQNGGGGHIDSLSQLNELRLPMIRMKTDWDRTLDVQLFHELFNVIEK